MKEEKIIRCKELMPAISEILESGQHVRLTVTGNSMFPFLRPGVDSVELVDPTKNILHLGDIVLITKETHQYVLHRIVSMNQGSFFIAGDAQNVTEGPFPSDGVIAMVIGIWRGDRYIARTDCLWRFLSRTWIILLPFRQYLLFFIRRFFALKRKWFNH